ncbi:MAG: Vitamin B12 import ATP-binding protein BtuD [Phycisphaerae bacterium]|nr:Vitamin B12 import ATP-binding protein BtuD [Phycisphaerae bacterium]
MECVQDIPEDLSPRLTQMLPPEDRRRVCLFGDVDLQGQYGRCVLAADDERLFFGPQGANGDGELAMVPLRDIRGLELRNYVGNGSLVVVRESDSLEVARFSQSMLDEFEKAAARIGELAEKSGARSDSGDGRFFGGRMVRKAPRCPQCGRALSPRAEVCLYCADKRKLVFRLVSLLKPYRLASVILLVITLSSTLLGLIPAYLTKYIVNSAIMVGNYSLFWVFIGVYAGCFLLIAALDGAQSWLSGWLGQTVIYDLRMRAFDSLQRLSLRYYESRQTGKLISRLTNDCERIERFIVDVLQQLIVDVLTLVIILTMLVQMNWRLTLVTLAPVPILFVMVYIFTRRIKRTYRKAWRTSASLTSHLADVIPGVRVVKGFAREPVEREQFAGRSTRLLNHMLSVFRLRASVFPVIGLLSRMGYLLLWLLGGYWAIQMIASDPSVVNDPARNPIGPLFAFTALLWRFYDPLGRLSRVTDQVQRATTSAERVFELLDAFPDVSEPDDPLHLPGRSTGRVHFKGVSFAYDSHVPVLDKVDLEIQPGEMIGVVGHSGVGKSTLASLLMRFYDPDEGEVLLDGVNVRRLTGSELRGNMGLVLQEPMLFHGSVLDNIRYGKPDASLEEVIAAAKVANAHGFLLRLPEGYDSQIGERGVRLSQGEKQRISIARAILRDPPILILDEATASVDTETERLIQAALDRLVKGRTVIAIAHRLSTLRHASRIIVLDGGGIAEMGTHEQLLARGGIYYDLCAAQSMLGRDLTDSPVARSAATAAVVEPEPAPEPEEYEKDEF